MGWMFSLVLLAPALFGQLSPTLLYDLDPTQPLGTVFVFQGSPGSTDPGPYQYRFRTRQGDAPFSVVRDFGPSAELIWGSYDVEGRYEIELTLRNTVTRETATTTATLDLFPLANSDFPVVSGTWHPLVFHYAAPACPAGASMKVVWQRPDGGMAEAPAKPCDGVRTMNFLVAGLRTSSAYTIWHELSGPNLAGKGPDLTFSTPAVEVPVASVQVSPTGADQPGLVLQSPLGQMIVAHDLQGNIIWFYANDTSNLTRPATGGRFLAIVQDPIQGTEHQAFRLFDLTGLTLKETNAARINEQLAAMDVHEITGFHHEALAMPDGKFLVLASSERILKDVQGAGEVDVVGDTIIVLDQELRVTWVWDSFDHLDPRQMAIMGETCTPAGGGCPAFYKAAVANDWLHSNSLHLAPDGNIIVSVRHLDQIIKIDYQNGVAWGEVLWRFGKDGDFKVESDDPWPWPSHQHDASILYDGTLLVYDNGNTRRAADALAHSRGQRWELDETTMTARPLLNADLGVYAAALGSAQLLTDGTYHFNSGYLFRPPFSMEAQSVQTDAGGNTVWKCTTPTPVYRTFRMKDLYTPGQ
ncbi:MAG: aryl-sulfate sulfotransferase [Bryobacteraceae bacterium]|nr:aryl-sulfate sulfotransferase [Bryobacteraceae bacterium]